MPKPRHEAREARQIKGRRRGRGARAVALQLIQALIDGDQFSIADITWMVLFHRLNELQILTLLLADREKVNSYYKRLKERDSFKNCIINFSDESTLLGIEKLKSDIKTSKNLSLFYQLMHEEIKPA